MKTTRVCFLLLAVFLCLPGLAQSKAKPDYYQQHKGADEYQKHLMKKHQKQEKAQQKAQEKAAKASRDRHPVNR